ncbi:MAG TPA: MarR family transcriptional regulator [Gemmatimonadaceae bacterium]|jgi:DNA-binding MarR family transcriptional regulator|nr:MarR family transcriptional regulator [Gemmatimonadaceae bacterium]
MTQEERVADRLHSAAIHVLRLLRREDETSGLTAPRLSALSVVVFAGPITLRDLAAAEGVTPPTMTRLVDGLEGDGLVVRRDDPTDGRAIRIRATAKGTKLLMNARAQRVAALTARVADLSPDDQALLGRAAEVMERISLPATPASAPRAKRG